MLNARLSDSLGQFSESSIEERLAENAELRALYIDRELSVIGEDVRFLSNTLSNILKSPEQYNPRKVAELREIEDVYAGEPYIIPHFLSKESSCAMPYYDNDGFAGVVGIACSSAEIYRQVADGVIGETGFNFVMNAEGYLVNGYGLCFVRIRRK